MEIIKIRVTLNGEKTALTALEQIDTKINEINKKQVSVNIKSGEAEKATGEVKNLGAAAKDTTKQSKLLGDTLSMIKFAAIGAAIGGVTMAFRDALTEMKAVDTQLTNIQKVSDKSAAEIQKLGDAAYATASKYGVAADEYLSAVYTFQKAGLGDSAEQLGELATKTMLVGDTSADVASKFLIATNAAWGLNGSYAALSTVVDEADYINNNYATSLDKLAAAMPIVASTSANLGMSVEETMAVIGTITSITQETGTKAATAWRALAMNITGELGSITDETGETIEVTTQSVQSMADAMKIYGNDAVKAAQQSGTLIDPMEAVISLAEAYKDGLLNDIELENILMNVGGKLRTNQLTALVKDLASDTSIYYDIMQKLPNAAGTADAEIGVMLSSWESKTNILKNTWTEFVEKSIRTDAVKGVLDVATALLDFGDNIGAVALEIGGVASAIKILKTAHDTQIASAIAAEAAEKGLATSIEAEAAASKAANAAGKTWIAGIGIAVTAVTLAAQAYEQYRQKKLEAATAGMEEYQKAATAHQEEAESLETLIAKYRELAEDGIGADEQEQIAKLQETINGLIGDEFYAVDLVNGAYDDQLTKLQNIQTAIEGKSRIELEAAKKQAEIALITSTQSLRGMADNTAMFTNREEVQKYLSPYSMFLDQEGQAKASLKWGFNADEIVEQYKQITAAIADMEEQESSAALGHSNLYKWLLTQRDEVADYAEALKALDEAIDQYGEDSDEAKAATDAVNDALNGIGENAEGAAEAINRVTQAKKDLDSELGKPAQDAAFTSIADAYKSLEDMIARGEINSNAFWATAEFLMGPEVIDQYYGNAEGLIELIQSSKLGTMFGDAERGAEGLVDALFDAADAAGSVANGAASITGSRDNYKLAIRDVGALASAFGVTEDEIYACLQALEEMGAYDFEGEALLDYLDYLGVTISGLGTAAASVSFIPLVTQLTSLGYSAPYIKNVVDNLARMGAIDMGGLDGSLENIRSIAGGMTSDLEEAANAADGLADTNLGPLESGLSDAAGAAGDLAANTQNAYNSAAKLNGYRVKTTYTADYVTNYTTNSTTTTTSNTGSAASLKSSFASTGLRYAGGTGSAAGGPALVGDEYSPDGSPRPELINDNGRTYLGGLNGPEIVRLGKGATVFTASETRDILRGGIPAYATGTTLSASYYVYIYYDANGGTGAPAATRLINGKAGTISTAKPTRSGYTFLGWSLSKTATAASYQPGATFKRTSNLTLYAVWKKNATATSSTSASATSKPTMDNLTTYNANYAVSTRTATYNTPIATGTTVTSGISGGNYSSSSSGGGATTTTTSTSSSGGGGGGSYTTGSGGTTASEPDPRDVLMDELKAKLQDAEHAIWLGQKNGSMTPQQIAKAYENAMSEVHAYAEKLRQMGEDENSDYIQELQKQWWEYHDDVADLQEDLISELKDAAEDWLDEAEKLKDKRVQAIRDAADAEEDLNKLEEKRLALLEAQDALLHAQSERTVRIYNAATGQWEWIANAADVKSAQESVEKAQKALREEEASQARDAEIEALEAEYDALEERYNELWKALETPGRNIDAIAADIAAIGTAGQKTAGSGAVSLAETIAAALFTAYRDEATGTVGGKSILYGASPYGTGGGILTGGIGGDGGSNYYINGVEISAERAETMTVAELARSLSALAIYNNS